MGLSILSLTLPIVPIALVAPIFAADDQTLTFTLNAIAIIPLTGILTRTTENISDRIGVALGALLNITLGNIVELIML